MQTHASIDSMHRQAELKTQVQKEVLIEPLDQQKLSLRSQLALRNQKQHTLDKSTKIQTHIKVKGLSKSKRASPDAETIDSDYMARMARFEKEKTMLLTNQNFSLLTKSRSKRNIVLKQESQHMNGVDQGVFLSINTRNSQENLHQTVPSHFKSINNAQTRENQGQQLVRASTKSSLSQVAKQQQKMDELSRLGGQVRKKSTLPLQDDCIQVQDGLVKSQWSHGNLETGKLRAIKQEIHVRKNQHKNTNYSSRVLAEKFEQQAINKSDLRSKVLDVLNKEKEQKRANESLMVANFDRIEKKGGSQDRPSQQNLNGQKTEVVGGNYGKLFTLRMFKEPMVKPDSSFDDEIADFLKESKLSYKFAGVKDRLLFKLLRSDDADKGTKKIVDFTAIQTMLNKQLKQQPDDPCLRLNKAVLLAYKHEDEKCLEIYQDLLQKCDSSIIEPGWQINFAIALLRSNQIQKCLELIKSLDFELTEELALVKQFCKSQVITTCNVSGAYDLSSQMPSNTGQSINQAAQNDDKDELNEREESSLSPLTSKNIKQKSANQQILKDSNQIGQKADDEGISHFQNLKNGRSDSLEGVQNPQGHKITKDYQVAQTESLLDKPGQNQKIEDEQTDQFRKQQQSQTSAAKKKMPESLTELMGQRVFKEKKIDESLPIKKQMNSMRNLENLHMVVAEPDSASCSEPTHSTDEGKNDGIKSEVKNKKKQISRCMTEHINVELQKQVSLKSSQQSVTSRFMKSPSLMLPNLPLSKRQTSQQHEIFGKMQRQRTLVSPESQVAGSVSDMTSCHQNYMPIYRGARVDDTESNFFLVTKSPKQRKFKPIHHVQGDIVEYQEINSDDQSIGPILQANPNDDQSEKSKQTFGSKHSSPDQSSYIDFKNNELESPLLKSPIRMNDVLEIVPEQNEAETKSQLQSPQLRAKRSPQFDDMSIKESAKQSTAQKKAKFAKLATQEYSHSREGIQLTFGKNLNGATKQTTSMDSMKNDWQGEVQIDEERQSIFDSNHEKSQSKSKQIQLNISNEDDSQENCVDYDIQLRLDKAQRNKQTLMSRSKSLNEFNFMQTTKNDENVIVEEESVSVQAKNPDLQDVEDSTGSKQDNTETADFTKHAKAVKRKNCSSQMHLSINEHSEKKMRNGSADKNKIQSVNDSRQQSSEFIPPQQRMRLLIDTRFVNVERFLNAVGGRAKLEKFIKKLSQEQTNGEIYKMQNKKRNQRNKKDQDFIPRKILRQKTAYENTLDEYQIHQEAIYFLLESYEKEKEKKSFSKLLAQIEIQQTEKEEKDCLSRKAQFSALNDHMSQQSKQEQSKKYESVYSSLSEDSGDREELKDLYLSTPKTTKNREDKNKIQSNVSELALSMFNKKQGKSATMSNIDKDGNQSQINRDIAPYGLANNHENFRKTINNYSVPKNDKQFRITLGGTTSNQQRSSIDQNSIINKQEKQDLFSLRSQTGRANKINRKLGSLMNLQQNSSLESEKMTDPNGSGQNYFREGLGPKIMVGSIQSGSTFTEQQVRVAASIKQAQKANTVIQSKEIHFQASMDNERRKSELQAITAMHNFKSMNNLMPVKKIEITSPQTTQDRPTSLQDDAFFYKSEVQVSDEQADRAIQIQQEALFDALDVHFATIDEKRLALALAHPYQNQNQEKFQDAIDTLNSSNERVRKRFDRIRKAIQQKKHGFVQEIPALHKVLGVDKNQLSCMNDVMKKLESRYEGKMSKKVKAQAEPSNQEESKRQSAYVTLTDLHANKFGKMSQQKINRLGKYKKYLKYLHLWKTEHRIQETYKQADELFKEKTLAELQEVVIRNLKRKAYQNDSETYAIEMISRQKTYRKKSGNIGRQDLNSSYSASMVVSESSVELSDVKSENESIHWDQNRDSVGNKNILYTNEEFFNDELNNEFSEEKKQQLEVSLQQQLKTVDELQLMLNKGEFKDLLEQLKDGDQGDN